MTPGIAEDDVTLQTVGSYFTGIWNAVMGAVLDMFVILMKTSVSPPVEPATLGRTIVTPVLKTCSLLAEAVNELVAQSTRVGLEIDEALAAAEQACGELACTVERVEGETRISALQVKPADTPLHALPRQELKIRLRATDVATKQLFSGSSGRFSWTYQKPPPEPL